jgi:hypothetical protein
VLTNWFNPERCVLVKITKDGSTFKEFPNGDPRVSKFDPADRKWVAAAIVYHRDHSHESPIIQAADHKWHTFVTAFKAHHVSIQFIC